MSDIDTRNVGTLKAAHDELRKLVKKLEELGVSRQEALEAAWDAYDLGMNRAAVIWSDSFDDKV